MVERETVQRPWEQMQAELAEFPKLAEELLEASDGRGFTLLIHATAKRMEALASLYEALAATPTPKSWLR